MGGVIDQDWKNCKLIRGTRVFVLFCFVGGHRLGQRHLEVFFGHMEFEMSNGHSK